MLKALVLGASPQSVRYMCQMCAEIPDLVVIRSLEPSELVAILTLELAKRQRASS